MQGAENTIRVRTLLFDLHPVKMQRNASTIHPPYLAINIHSAPMSRVNACFYQNIAETSAVNRFSRYIEFPQRRTHALYRCHF